MLSRLSTICEFSDFVRFPGWKHKRINSELAVCMITIGRLQSQQTCHSQINRRQYNKAGLVN